MVQSLNLYARRYPRRVPLILPKFNNLILVKICERMFESAPERFVEQREIERFIVSLPW